MKTLSKIILINGDNVTPYPDQYLIDTGKTIELWQRNKHSHLRVKRWIKIRHIALQFSSETDK